MQLQPPFMTLSKTYDCLHYDWLIDKLAAYGVEDEF